MTTFTTTTAQAAALAARWNDLANESNQITADHPHFDLAVMRYGLAEIVGRLAARVARPLMPDEIAALCRELETLGGQE